MIRQKPLLPLCAGRGLFLFEFCANIFLDSAADIPEVLCYRAARFISACWSKQDSETDTKAYSSGKTNRVSDGMVLFPPTGTSHAIAEPFNPIGDTVSDICGASVGLLNPIKACLQERL